MGTKQSLRAEATSCLKSMAEGDQSSRNRLFEMLYADLRDQASTMLRTERAGHTLQSTALVHEVWLRLIDQDRVEAKNKGHFMALAAMAMRRILVDHANRRGRQKRGGSWRRLELDDLAVDSEPTAGGLDLLAVDQALNELHAQSERMAKIVELRFFGGLSRQEVAEALGISHSTVVREWRAARALMTRLLDDNAGLGETAEPGPQ